MSTLSGNVSKGEKGKSKFQSLDINNLYRTSRGESLEQHQQKNTIPRKHGMQSLGKVPSARRPPANLPSLKSEHSGSDPAVSLVPSGGSGWATTKDPATQTTNTTSNATTTPPTTSDTTTSNTPSTQCATGAAPATASPLQPPQPGQQNTSQTSHSTAPSWSAIMSRPGDAGGPVVAAVLGYAGLVGGGRGGRGALGLSFLAHQSPQFQHEFPSLSGQPSVSISNQSQTQQSSTTPNANSNAISVAAQQQSLLPQQSQSHSHSGDGTAGPQQPQSQQARELTAQYGPGPSLRPQTEGSWIQGGSRTASGTGAGTPGPGNGSTPGVQGPPHIGVGGLAEGPAGGRPNLGQSLTMGMAQAGPNGSPTAQGATTPGASQNPSLHNYRGLIPPFMYRGSFPGGFPSQFPPNMGANGPRQRFTHPQERFPAPPRQQERERPPPPADEEIITRPIIKEEDLSRMDDISRDAGWAAHDDIDYNQKLAFSDDETEHDHHKKDDKKDFKDDKREESQPEEKEKSREREREPRDNREQPQSHRGWNQGPPPLSRDFRGTNGPVNYPPQQQIRTSHPPRGLEEDELWNQRRREQGEKVASTVERARQRKEEEEKRFRESIKQAADKKLQDLEQKIKEKYVKQKDDDSGSSSEPKSLISVPSSIIPVPDWERDRENRESRERDRSRTSSEGKDEKPVSRESRDSRDTRDTRDIRDTRETRDTRDTRETRDTRDARDARDPRDTRDVRETRDTRDVRDTRDTRDIRDTRDTRDTRDIRDTRDSRDSRDQPVSEFRQITQIERPSFMRSQDISRNERDRDRDQREIREREQPAFSKHFQNDLPPRFQKQQAERTGGAYNRVSPNAEQRPAPQPVPFSQQYDPSRWVHSSHPNVPNSVKKQSHSMPLPQRRNRTDSELSGPIEDDRPPSRDHRGLPRDDRYRHSSHRSYDGRKPSSGSYYDDHARYREYEYDDRHSRDSWERERHYDDRDRDNREIQKKDYENYSKSSPQQDPFDEREPARERPENPEWRDDRRDMRDDRITQERQSDSRRDPPRDDRIDRSERPQRPDSRDSRASRESRTSLRDDDMHKSRDCGSWVNDIPDYEEKKRDLYREDNRDRRQPPGPVTREKLEADELKGEKRNLTQLKRSGSEMDKKDCSKDSPTEAKKELDVWNRKLELSSENNRNLDRGGDNSPKAWADAISPTLEMEDEKVFLEPMKDEKEIDEMKQSMEKLSVDNKRDDAICVEVKEDLKDEKRDKNVRNRTNSGSSRGRESGRSARQYGGYSVYSTRGWRGADQRGRRVGPRSVGRPGSARSGSYGHTDSELSGDEISGSTESGKEERRPGRSPKPSQKLDKDDRNREVSRRDDKRGDYTQVRSDKRSYDSRSGREGFAPSGEPSRRGRGGFRNRGPTTGGRMNTNYGPPPSKSPFSTERNADDKEPSQQKPSSPTPESELPASGAQLSESTDDKIIAKQQALTAGITGRHTKSPSQQSQQQGNNKQESLQNQNTVPQRSQGRKDEGRTKRNHSSSRRTQGRDHRDGRFRGNPSNAPKQNSSDVGNDDWETTSDNSEEHIEDRKESRNTRNKSYGSRGNQSSHQNPTGNNQQSRRNDQSINNREQRERNAAKPGNTASRAPGAEKRNAQNASYNQRNHSGAIPPLMQNTQQNGRPRSQGSANSGPSSKAVIKESTVNRVDEIKLNDLNLVNQALNDINKKSVSKEKKVIDGELEVNNYSGGGDDGANSNEDKIDADGFQEVRSKKNVKESRHNQKEEAKPMRREKEKERERDRSKSKSNGPQPTPQQIQNIPPLLGQPIPQPANLPQKQFDRERNSNRQTLAPRFQKARLAKQQQQMGIGESNDTSKVSSNNIYASKDSAAGPAPPPSVNAWDKPFTSQIRSNSPSTVSADIQLMSGITGQSEHNHETNEQVNSRGSSQRNSPNTEKTVNKTAKDIIVEKNVSDGTSPPVQTLIFENTNYSKTTKSGPSDLTLKSKFSNHMKTQQRVDKRGEIEDDGQMQQHQQQALSAVFSNKSNELMKDKSQEPIQMPLSFSKNEDNADMKLDFTFDSELSQLTEDAKSKSLGMPRSIHMTGSQSTISPSTAELNLKIASVKKVWENAPPMPTVVEHEDGNVVATANSFPQPFESNDVDDSYSPHQQYNQSNMKNEIATSTNVCKLVPPQVKPQQQSAGSTGAQPGSTVPGPSPIGPGQSPIGHPSASLQGQLSPPPFNTTGQPSHINYQQEFPQYPGSQAAQYGGMSAIPSPPAVLFNTGSGQLPAQAGGLYGAFQLDQSRSPFTQYPPYAPSLQSSFNQQSVYLQQPPPPPHAPSATPDMYQNNMSQYRITTAAAPPFGQNQQLSNNPNTVLISSSSNSLMSASVKPSTQPIGAIGTKATHFQAPSAQPNQLTYIPYDPNQVLGVSGNYMGNSQLVQRPGPTVQPSQNSYYSATSAGKPNTLLYVFPGSQTGFYQPGGAGQQTGTPYGLQGFGQHSQSLATGSATPVGLQNFGSQFLSGSGIQMAAAAQQYRNPTGGLPGPGNAAATFLGKHQQQEQSRQLKSPSGNQQDVLASVFSSTSQIPSPKSRNCKQQTPTQQPQPSPTQIHKYQQYQGVTQSALVLQQNVRGMGMPPPRPGIQPSQQRYPAPIQRPAPFPPGPNPNPGQQQPNCMPTQQQQQAQMNRHRPNIHQQQQQQQQQQRNMKMSQQYYSSQGNVKMDSNDKQDSHNEKMSESSNGTQPGNKANVNQQDGENKEEVNQQNE